MSAGVRLPLRDVGSPGGTGHPTTLGCVVHPRSSLRALAAAVTGLLLAAPTAVLPAASPAAASAGTSAAASAGAPRAALPAAAPDDEGYDAPLEITIKTLTPGVLPRSGPLVVQGTVTNVDLETWTGVSLYPLVNSGPDCDLAVCAEVMTTPAALDLAAASDAEDPVGVRDPAISDDIDVLEPGESMSYSLRIPQAALRVLFPSPTSGVYWFGVHALGSSERQPYDKVADGRARTFLPYASARLDTPVDTAVVVPLRGRVARTEDGALDRPAQWERALGVDGDLGGPLAFGAASGAAPVTWLVDPAVPDAVQQLALGNPDREIAPTPDPDEPSPSESASDEESEEDADDEARDTPLARAARSWLERAEDELSTGSVATVPYGDPDLAATATSLPELYRTARDLRGSVLSAWEVEGTGVVAPPDGFLDPAGIDTVDDDAPLVLSDRMFPTENFPQRPPVDALVGERPVLVSARGAASGGPGPDPALAPVALRQRILSEAVVRALRADGQGTEPLVVVLPSTVTALDAPEFWEGLDTDLVRLTPLDQLVEPADAEPDGRTQDERQVDPSELAYPTTQERKELPGAVMAEAGRLIQVARTLQGVLGERYTIGTELVGEALTGTSYAVRDEPAASSRLASTRAWVQEQLDQVTIDGPNGVTLSGTSGSFNVAVRNDLDHPVTVQVRASTDGGAEVEVANPVRLAANSRTAVPISAAMSRTGVHNVTLRLTDADGRPLGAQDSLPLRTGQAGVVIWAIIGTGAGILFLAIGIRLFRRFHRRDDEAGDQHDTAAEPEPAP